MLTVAELMTREPYTLLPENTVADARQLMTEHHIRHIPILCPGGDLVGVVTQRDVLAAQSPSHARGQSRTGSNEDQIALSTIMTSPVHTVDEHAGLRGTALHLQKHKLGCLPVLNNNKLVGIVTDSDFVTIAITLMEQLESTESDELDYEEDFDAEDF